MRHATAVSARITRQNARSREPHGSAPRFFGKRLTAVAWRMGVPRTWLVLGVLTVLLPLGSGSFKSDARFGLFALPVYWGLAWLCRDRRLFAAVFAISAVLLGAATVTLPLVFP